MELEEIFFLFSIFGTGTFIHFSVLFIYSRNQGREINAINKIERKNTSSKK
jgi:hypothetical protein